MAFGQNNDIQFSAGLDSSQYKRELTSMMRSTRNFGVNMGNSVKSIESPFKSLKGTLIQASSNLIILSASYIALKKSMEGLLGPGFQVNSMLETNSIAFDKMIGKTTDVKQYMRDLTTFAIKTPFSMEGVVSGTKKLIAYGFQAKETIGVMRRLGDATAGLGMSTEGLDRIILAVGQIRSKGKLLGNEAKQLAETGLNIYQAVADNLNISLAKAMKMGEDGMISSTLALESLYKFIDNRFGGMMEKQQKTYAGALAALKDNIGILNGIIVKDMFTGVTNTMVKVNNIFGNFFESYNYWVDSGMSTTNAFLYSFNNIINSSGKFNGVVSILEKAMNAYSVFKGELTKGYNSGNLFDGFKNGLRSSLVELFGLNSEIVILFDTMKKVSSTLIDIAKKTINFWNGLSDSTKENLVNLSVGIYLAAKAVPLITPIFLVLQQINGELKFAIDGFKNLFTNISKVFKFNKASNVLAGNELKLLEIKNKRELLNISTKQKANELQIKYNVLKKQENDLVARGASIQKIQSNRMKQELIKNKYDSLKSSYNSKLNYNTSQMNMYKPDIKKGGILDAIGLGSMFGAGSGAAGAVAASGASGAASTGAIAGGLKVAVLAAGKLALVLGGVAVAAAAIAVAVGLGITAFKTFQKDAVFMERMKKQGEDIRKAWVGFVNGIKSAWNKFYNENKVIFTEINNMLKDLFAGNGDLIKGVLDLLLKGFKSILVVAKLLLPVFKAIVYALVSTRDAWSDLVADFKDDKNIMDNLKTIFNAPSTIGGAYKSNYKEYYTPTSTALSTSATEKSFSGYSLAGGTTQVVNVNLDAKNFKDVNTAVGTLSTLQNNLRMGTTY